MHREPRLTRRALIRAGAAAVAAPAVLRVIPANAQSRVIKIGFVNPQTGPLAAFGEPTAFLIEHARKATGGMVDVAGKKYEFQVVTRDSQSTGNRAADVTADLILREKVDLLIAGGAPDTTNAVASQAEINEVPCINTACPWQPWFFGRKGDPKVGFNWTYLFCFGVEDIHAAFLDLWSGAQTNQVVGGLFANDPDGNAWAQALPPALQKSGFKVVETGRYQPFTDDFSSFIAAFKAAGAEIITGTMTPPDFATFWTQAAQQGFRPKIATIGKAFLFPSAVAALGDRAEGLSCEVPWSPLFPFKSGLTGQSGAELADEYTKQTGRPSAFIVGMFHALFEVAIDALRRTKAIDDPRSIRDAILQTNYNSIQGPVNWTSGRNPVKNVSKTPIVAGQWDRPAAGQLLRMAIKANAGWADIPTAGKLRLMS
jgi:branched-chain amino acid transport system substrate-binding protein